MIFLLTFADENELHKFEFIYGKYKRLLLYKAWEILGDQMLAEDAVSEAFLRIYKNLHKVDDPSSNQSAAFFVTITKNAALTLLQKRKKESHEELFDAYAENFDLEEHIVAKLSSEEVYASIAQMGETLKSVFLYKYAYDLSNKEIGGLLNLTENNVAVLLHRAKKKLCRILAERGYAHEA